MPVGGAAEHAIVRSEAEAKTAWAEGETVIILEAVEVLPQTSVNDHDSVYVPSHAL